MKNTFDNQAAWLMALESGTVVYTHNGKYMRIDQGNDFVDLDNGCVTPYQRLLNLSVPPRIESRPSPFSS